MYSKFKWALVTVILSGLGVYTGYAADDAVVLTIDGAISGGAPRDFTIEALEALGVAAIETTTPWHDGVVKFEGVPLSSLMNYVGASGETAFVIALNNYTTEIPLSDFEMYGVILASRKDGEAMPVADKGPLFVVYPFDSDSSLHSELYYSRSAWQVRQITVE